MEAATLRRKKQTLSKGKIKKTVKNVICRPDPVIWPILTEEREELLNGTLSKLKINVPVFKKLPWSELKDIPKQSRPKQPQIPKVNGLTFGINQCYTAVTKGECSAVIIEALLNPRVIVHSLLEACLKNDVPVVCLHNLRKTTLKNFGIPTSSLGVNNHCTELKNKVHELAKTLVIRNIAKREENNELDSKMEVDKPRKDVVQKDSELEKICPYLYRNNKKTRIFIPTTDKKRDKVIQDFSGQDFIEFTEKKDKVQKRKDYMNMILKRISNNPNRKVVK